MDRDVISIYQGQTSSLLNKTRIKQESIPVGRVPSAAVVAGGVSAQGTVCPRVQGLSIPFACVGSGDPVRVLRLYTMNTLDTL